MSLVHDINQLKIRQTKLEKQQVTFENRLGVFEFRLRVCVTKEELAEAAQKLQNEIEKLRELVFGSGPPAPGPVTIRVVSEEQGENGMADKLTFAADILQPDYDPAKSDIEKTKVTVLMTGGVEQVLESGAPVKGADDKYYSTVEGLTGDQGAEGKISSVNVDDEGNESELSEETFTLRDTLKPQKAGSVTLRVTAEEEGVVPPVEPPVEPPVV